MGKVSNTITMIELLSTGRKYSIEELSSILEVTPRMVRVYKEELDKAGIYVDTIRGPYGGYVLNQAIKIPIRDFNQEDINILQKVKDSSSVSTEINLLIDKIKGIIAQNDSKVLFEEGVLDKYNVFARAIKEKRKVKILYDSLTKGENERIIRPYNMFLYHDGWGVASFCESRQDLRHFELKRIIKYELLTDTFE